MKLQSAVVVWAAASVILCASSAGAADRGRNQYQKELESWSAVIVELQQADKTGQSSQEIERIRNLVSQAQAFLAAEKLKEIDPALERSAALAALVRARSDRIVAEEEADKVEVAAQRAEKEAREARAAADAAQQKYDELEAKGL
jgi:hypothetical protein